MNIIEILPYNNNWDLSNTPDEIVLHHAESTNCTILDINKWHLANGWVGCGYHFFVRKDGSIYRGRPELAVGAHCPSANTHSIGICAEGAFMKDIMSDVQRLAIIALCQMLIGKYPIKAIYGHRELYSTSCPCDVVTGGHYPLQNIKDLSFNKTVQAVPTVTQTTTATIGDIKSLQRLLNALGDHLVVDGVVGPKTLGAISVYTLRLNVSGDIVKWLQLRLVLKGYTSCKVTMMFDSGTLAVVKKFQTNNSLVSDGIVGPKTWAVVLS